VKDIYWENTAFRQLPDDWRAVYIRNVYTLKTPVGFVSVSSRMQSCVMNKLCVCFSVVCEWANSRRKQHESNYSLEIVCEIFCIY
jgi:hypothetical protein